MTLKAAAWAKLSGTTVTNEYLFDTDGSQQIELNGSGAVLHTNLYAGGKLIATYQGTNTYFHFTDWLGTRRYEANSAGAMTETCTNLPFGDSQSCTGTPDATEQHFTGKEHDTESGLDYFGARYYANVLGRFVTPDWDGKPTTVPYATFVNPQTLNLYGYVRNQPIIEADTDGHCAVICASIIAGTVTYISSKLGEAIYDGKKISSLRESYKQDSKLLQEALGQNPAARNVNVDGLIKDMRNIQMDANKEGVKLASDLLAATDPIKPSGSGSEIERAVGVGIGQAVDATKTAVDAQDKLNQARDAAAQQQQQGSSKSQGSQPNFKTCADSKGCQPQPNGTQGGGTNPGGGSSK